MEQLELSHIAGGKVKTQLLWKFLIMLNKHLPYDPAIPLLGIYAEETKTCILMKIS